MPPEDAVILTNMFPTSGRLVTRNGFSEWATELGGEVEMLAEFNAGATRKMIAAADGSIFDVSTIGPVGAALATGFSSNRWQWAQFDDSGGGARMGLVNGFDDPQIYDGSTIASMTVSGSGLTPSDLVGIHIFKNRSYFWEVNSQNFWYSAVGALGGTLTKFPLGRVSGFGGNLIAMANWSRDAGDGEDDLAVFVMDSGDIVVYKGDDPGDADAWALVGIYRGGAPLGVRAITKLGSDVIVMTKDGYVPLSKIINLGRITEVGSISDKIQDEVNRVAQLYAANYGWQAILYPRGQYILFNVPISSDFYQQHIINTSTQAWCKFEGMNGICWSLFNDRLYFGGVDGTVYLADDGNTDNGSSINIQVYTAWNYIVSRNYNKKLSGVRIYFDSATTFTFTYGIGTDFINPTVFSSINSNVPAQSMWDEALWDVDFWGNDNIITKPWLSGNAYGMNFLLRVLMSVSNGPVNWYSYEYLYEPGGLI
ncbi:MAG: hypothetical protein AB7F19_07710 [Candidatus Babeliales bacterium]